MEKLVIRILDKKAVKKLQDLANKKMIEINHEEGSNPVDWEKYIGSLQKMTLPEIKEELASFRNWG